MIYYATFDHFKIYAKKKPKNYLLIMLAIKILQIAVYIGSVGRREMCQRAHSVTATIWFGKCDLGMNCLAPFIGTILIELVHYVLKTMKTFTNKYNSRWEHNLSCQKKCHELCHLQTRYSCFTQCMPSDKLTYLLIQN